MYDQDFFGVFLMTPENGIRILLTCFEKLFYFGIFWDTLTLQRVFVWGIEFTKKSFRGCLLSSFGNVTVKKDDVKSLLKKVCISIQKYTRRESN